MNLAEGMQKLAEGLAKAAGGAEIQKRTYRGVDMVTASLRPSSSWHRLIPFTRAGW